MSQFGQQNNLFCSGNSLILPSKSSRFSIVTQPLGGLHTLGHFDAEEAHAVADDLGHVAGQHQTHLLLGLVGFVQDGVVVVELVEDLRQFVDVVGDAEGE